MFKGLYTALVTPFLHEKIDIDSYHKIINAQIDGGVNGIVIGASTGEGVTLSFDEYVALLKVAVQYKDKIKVVASITSASTFVSIKMAHAAQDIDVSGLMCITPFYNRPPQRALIEYFTDVHDATSLPIMLYAVPSRTGVDFTDDTIITLAELPRILALKDACGDLLRTLRLKNKIRKDFNILAGDDIAVLAQMVHGASGVVSVVSNVLPQKMSSLVKMASDGKFADALELLRSIYPLLTSMSLDVNPITVKCAMSLVGLCSKEMRKPLVSILPKDEAVIKEVLTSMHMLNNVVV